MNYNSYYIQWRKDLNKIKKKNKKLKYYLNSKYILINKLINKLNYNIKEVQLNILLNLCCNELNNIIS